MAPMSGRTSLERWLGAPRALLKQVALPFGLLVLVFILGTLTVISVFVVAAIAVGLEGQDG